jgi:hypothetical protein
MQAVRPLLGASSAMCEALKARGGLQATTRAADYRSVQSPPPKLRDDPNLQSSFGAAQTRAHQRQRIETLRALSDKNDLNATQHGPRAAIGWRVM